MDMEGRGEPVPPCTRRETWEWGPYTIKEALRPRELLTFLTCLSASGRAVPGFTDSENWLLPPLSHGVVA